MEIILKIISLNTRPGYIIDITEKVRSELLETKLRDGMVCIFVAGSTAAISTIEFEPGLVKTDVPEFLEKIIPYDGDYGHHQTWGDHNGAGHLRSFLIKTSQTFPFKNKRLLLGTWEQVIFCEFDEKGRNRNITITIIGE